MKKIFDGYFFNASGMNFGPSIMIREEEWDQELYEELERNSSYDNHFVNQMKEYNKYDSDPFEYFNHFAKELYYDFTPGKKYRIIIKEMD